MNGTRNRLSAGIHGHQRACQSLSGLSDRLEMDFRVCHADHGVPRDFPHSRLSPKGCPMRLAVPKEIREGETRVAATPESVKKFKGLGLDVVVQAGAGSGAKIADADYTAAGATIAPDAASTYRDADIVLKVR